MGDNHQGKGSALALDSMARLWFKRTDKHINKNVSLCEMTRKIEREGEVEKQHMKVSLRGEVQRGKTERGRHVEGFLCVKSRLGLDQFATTEPLASRSSP